ncbi:MAG: amidohydrolase family protein, partial [Verrucomicrobiales bacterium]
FVALVGNVDPYSDDFESEIKRLKADKRFVGVRARNGGSKKAIDFTDSKVLGSCRTLAGNELSLDILVNGGGVGAVKMIDQLARAVPELHIVVNHALGYNFDGEAADGEWVTAVEQLGQNKNVWCKISGLYQRSVPQPAPHSIEHYRSVIDVLWKNFGPERLVFGSNWPCTKNSGDYLSYVKLVNEFFAAKGEEASERYFWKNASEAYRLKPE